MVYQFRTFYMFCKNVIIISYSFMKFPTYSNTFNQATLFHGNQKGEMGCLCWIPSSEKHKHLNSKSKAAAPKEFWARKNATDSFTASFKMTNINRRVNMLMVTVLLIRNNFKWSLCLMGNSNLLFFPTINKKYFKNIKIKNSFCMEDEL